MKLKADSAHDRYHPAKVYPSLVRVGISHTSTVSPYTSTVIFSLQLFGTKVKV